ncbi:EAL domain-containing protein [Geodermatophilus sp. DSM 44513]|uniref:putative bifunctional diguanylate cyclase/phosphodiesterase n=1 Tax=Geodermatophilus sp. DSM 44513 TaxID=1528104 RepID=UPI001286D4BD|nr:EAL domain-containing protein [Geodermatophilus sp. DSM 44513]WNV74208.1 EAL domain-containing protein [Geodermatophilus sp. DSM 44513]
MTGTTVPARRPGRRPPSGLGARAHAALATLTTPGTTRVHWLMLGFASASCLGVMGMLAGSEQPAGWRAAAAVLTLAAALCWRRPGRRPWGPAAEAARVVLEMLALAAVTVAAPEPQAALGLLYAVCGLRSLQHGRRALAALVGLDVLAYASGVFLAAQLGQPPASPVLALLPVVGLVVTSTAMQLLVESLRGQAAAQRAQEASHAQLSAIVQTSPAAMLLIDPDDRLVTWNRAAERLFELPPRESIDGPVRLHRRSDRSASGGPVHADAVAALHARALAGEELHDEPLAWVRRDGGAAHLAVSTAPVRLSTGEALGVVAVATDVTERERLHERLRTQAVTDELTGLGNRSLLTDRLRRALAGGPGRGTCALLLLDLDGFKAVNDTGGHEAGDRLLQRTAAVLREAVRRTDTVGRLGGDEFVVLLEQTTAAGAEAAADTVLAALRSTVRLPNGSDIRITASMGVTVLDDRWGGDAEQALADADIAMYAAKRAGRDRWTGYDPAMRRAVADRVRLETELRAAVAHGQVAVHYQPYVDLLTGRITGVEALARWQHPRRGLVTPAEFIPLAEESGLIVPLGRQVLQQAVRQARAWQLAAPGEPLLTVSVNLSVRQLAEPGLLDTVAQVLADTGLPAHTLTLELTESLLAADDEDVVALLHRLKRLGVRLAVDDFGTGFSALAYLQRFPLDVLKVDRSFVRDVTTPDSAALTAAVVALARSLRLATVAEGIETAEQAVALRALGCDTAQGFHFARPMPAPELTALLDRHYAGTGPLALPAGAPRG